MKALEPYSRTKLLSEASTALRKERALVLVAEDDPDMRNLISRQLRKSGFEVVEAADGIEAMDRIDDALLDLPPRRFDLVIADVRMPGRTGLELLASLRTKDWALPVILITAFGNVETHALAQLLGAWAVFNKPFDLYDLQTAALNSV